MGQKMSKDDWSPSKQEFQEEIPHPRQVKTDEGLYVWKVDDMDLLTRCIVLGSDTAYNASNQHPQRMSVQCLERLISGGRGEEVVSLISRISHHGFAPRQNYLIYALAVCASSNNIETKKMAYNELCNICRTPTHVFLFVQYCKQEKQKSGVKIGWGRAHKRAVLKWYEKKSLNPEGIARLLTKYKRRRVVRAVGKKGVWSHRDIFRLAHPSPSDALMKVVVTFVMKGFEKAQILASNGLENAETGRVQKFLTYIEGTTRALKCTDESEMVELITKYKLEREHVPTQMLDSKSVCEAIIKNMKAEAKIRNLRMLSAKGFCEEKSDIENEIVETLTNREVLHHARVHPLKVLSALWQYEKGEKENKGTKGKKGEKGKQRKLITWTVNKNIVAALNEAFELSFDNVPLTHKRFLLAVNVSNTMKLPCKGFRAVKGHQAAAAMMMMTARNESKCKIFGFSEVLSRILIAKNDSLSQVIKKMDSMKVGEADSALPMIWAKENKKKIDVFIVYTDNIHTRGQTDPTKALKDYRKEMNIPEAKLVVVAMAPNKNTDADPDETAPLAENLNTDGSEMHDYGAINIVGFDAKAAELIAQFVKGEL